MTDLRRLLADPAFDRPPNADPAALHAHAYAALARIRAVAGPAPDLLADRDRLRDLATWTTVRDPLLFHLSVLHYCLCLNGIARFAPDPAAALARVGDDTGILLMTEAGRSNSHGAIATEAHYDTATREFTLRTPTPAAVKFPTNAAPSDVPKTALVYARLVTGGTAHGVFTFALRIGGPHGTPPGLRLSPVDGSTALPVDFAAVAFDGLRLPFDAWHSDGAAIDDRGRLTDPLGTPDARLRRSMSVGVATWHAITAAAAAAARAAATIAIRYSRTRLTADRLSGPRPLLDYRNQHIALLTALADACAITSLTEPGDPAPEPAGASTAWVPWSAVDPLLPLYKAVAVDTAWRAVTECREHCGALGYAATPKLLAYQSLMDAYRTAGGDNTLIRLDTARSLAAGYEAPEDDPPDEPRTAADFLALARSCERRLVATLRERLAQSRAVAEDEFGVWNGQLELAIETAAVHAERLLMERFAPEGGDLAALHGAAWARRRAASLQRCGLAVPASALERRAHELCDRLLPKVSSIVDGFGFEPAHLGTFLGEPDHLAAFADRYGFADLG
ncbi:acyl-CoA dehydrogenase [Glycomyces paridis]|uniref:Uncharacterized protein n=1 Tax=Glycomyces paridis TaxID=2126555 RepID=A0A4S8PJM7_9ACTN|nr:acyl-CoA dehydrogenase [Glycomyces paridis]THV30880.1 hypothetical protein E9998_05780 [Glycomyces paridis]